MPTSRAGSRPSSQAMARHPKVFVARARGGGRRPLRPDRRPRRRPNLDRCLRGRLWGEASAPVEVVVFAERPGLTSPPGFATDLDAQVQTRNAAAPKEAARDRHHRNSHRDPPVPRRVRAEDIDDLRRRIAATRWPSKELVADRSQGVRLADAAGARALLADEYDFGRIEARLNALPAVHDRDRRRGRPLHPRPLAARGRAAADHDPRLARLGHRAARHHRPADRPDRARRPRRDAFHLVLPSLPGYGFSAEPTELGWDLARIARAWAELMRRLGYNRYVAQGGDVGRRRHRRDGPPGPEGWSASTPTCWCRR